MRNVLVTGGTGNIGPFVVAALLDRGATVVVPSRSADRLDELRAHLGERDRLYTVVGDVGDQDVAAELRRRIIDQVGAPDAVVASLGDFVTAPSLLDADIDALRRVLDGYVVSHFTLAREFLPAVRDAAGTYLFVQGPLAFAPVPGFGTDLISVATAAQHMLFRALARELDDDAARVVELVVRAFVRQRETQPGSALTGEDIGAVAAHLLSDASGTEIHGQSLDYRTPDELPGQGR